MIVEAREITIAPEDRDARGRRRALEEALDEMREAYWHALDQGERRVIVTLSVKVEWKNA